MGVKYCPKEKLWIASYSERHPKTRQPKSLRRKRKTKAEAMRAYNDLVVEVREALKKAVVPSWSELLERFFHAKRLEGWTEKTLYNCSKCLSANTLPVWGDRFVDTITGDEVRELFLGELGGRSNSHQQYVYRYIRAAFEYALECGFVLRNPCPRIPFKRPNKLKEVLTEEQVGIFLERAKAHGSEWYLHWVMAVYTGMRNGELYALTWDKVNLEDRTIKVDCSWSSKNGYKDTKSGDDRVVEIAPNLIQVLREHKLENPDTHFVLPRMRNWDKGEQSRFLRMFLEGCGLPSIRFHALRATWATIMLSKGVEAIKVMKMGGWAHLKTLQVYARMAGVDIRGITDGLDLHNPSRDSASILAFQGPRS